MIAYLDESGSHGFNFKSEGTSTHFVVCSIFVDNRQQERVAQTFTGIKERYFPQSELKSSKIGNRDHIRRKLLEEVKGLDFRIFCLIVDKRKIHLNSGLQYKESFYKFLYGILYNRIYKTFNDVAVVADRMISSDFVESFEKYIRDNHIANLFQQANITFSDSKKNILLQLADLIGGSINRYSAGKSAVNPLDILREKVSGEYYWPEEQVFYTVDVEPGNEFTKEISELALLRINSYIDKNIDSTDKLVRIRVMFLYYLRGIFFYDSSTRFIHSHEIINHLQQNTGEEIKEQYLRQQIVGPLRSEGILIVSNTNGYKVPSSKNDIITFFNLFSKIINPMIKRLQKSHEALYQVTQGKLDILAYPEFEYLKKLIEK